MNARPYAHIVIPSILAASVALMLAAALTREKREPGTGEAETDEYVIELNREANRLASLGKHDKALAILDRVLETHPDSAPTHYNRGRIFHVREDHETALGEYDRALDIRPDYPKALTNRALLLAPQGDVEKAVADLTRAIELAPDRTAAWYHRGRLMLGLGRFTAARADLDRVLELDPYDEKALALQAEADGALRGRTRAE